MLRAVLDVNVLISALLSPHGASAACVVAWRDGRFDLVVSPALRRELEDVAGREHLSGRIDDGDLSSFVSDLTRNGVMLDDPPAERHVPSDPDDDYLITLALAAHAQAIVTGDAALLALDLDRPRIVTPREFIAALGSLG